MPAKKPTLPVRTQVSAGGVAVRRTGGVSDVVIVRVGTPGRWQLPKGLVAAGESPEAAAIRETREEGGVETELVAPLETIEYWYVGTDPDASRGASPDASRDAGADGARVRFHKFVHFFLLQYLAGDPSEHDWEVQEARWATLEEAEALLAFRSERQVLARARELLG
ncbi:MAG TPA: NUDIX domain-containing protein [Gemmatimonadaceae bacterium]|nr:NUDIX domain-containing protein [Gemmatimonadaceae bacterium]